MSYLKSTVVPIFVTNTFFILLAWFSQSKVVPFSTMVCVLSLYNLKIILLLCVHKTNVLITAFIKEFLLLTFVITYVLCESYLIPYEAHGVIGFF